MWGYQKPVGTPKSIRALTNGTGGGMERGSHIFQVFEWG